MEYVVAVILRGRRSFEVGTGDGWNVDFEVEPTDSDCFDRICLFVRSF
jgi:hypothetical protein